MITRIKYRATIGDLYPVFVYKRSLRELKIFLASDPLGHQWRIEKYNKSLKLYTYNRTLYKTNLSRD